MKTDPRCSNAANAGCTHTAQPAANNRDAYYADPKCMTQRTTHRRRNITVSIAKVSTQATTKNVMHAETAWVSNPYHQTKTSYKPTSRNISTKARTNECQTHWTTGKRAPQMSD